MSEKASTTLTPSAGNPSSQPTSPSNPPLEKEPAPRATPCASSNPHLEDEYGQLEQQEHLRRGEATVRELSAILARVKDVQLKSAGTPPGEIPIKQRHELFKALTEALEVDAHPDVKPSVIRRMGSKIGQYVLWNRLSSTPVIHELVALLPWWLNNLPSEVVPKLRDIGLSYVLNGAVLPLQGVWKEVLESQAVFLGHCVCRSSGLTDDLKRHGKTFTLQTEAKKRLLLDRFTDRYLELLDAGALEQTDPIFHRLGDLLARYRREGDERYRLETLLEETYPTWEILPVHKNYTTDWIRSMYANRKAHPIHKELVLEFATLMFLSRGSIFTNMRLFDTPYTICTCPTPENGGGCILTNWYYYGMSNQSLMPNELEHGRLRDGTGDVLPCRYFPVRKERECLGCGCIHEEGYGRGMEVILREADEVLERYRAREDG